MMLNEHAQKHNIPLPEYDYIWDTERNGFIAICNFNDVTRESKFKNTKKEAQEESARYVYEDMFGCEVSEVINSLESYPLERMSASSTSNGSKSIDDTKLILLVDLDNQRTFMNVKDEINYVKFIGVCGPNMNIDPIDTWKDTIIKTPSVVKDAADLELVWRTCEVYKSFPKDSKVIIISRDFSLKHLEEILVERGVNAVYYTNYKDFMKTL